MNATTRYQQRSRRRLAAARKLTNPECRLMTTQLFSEFVAAQRKRDESPKFRGVESAREAWREEIRRLALTATRTDRFIAGRRGALLRPLAA